MRDRLIHFITELLEGKLTPDLFTKEMKRIEQELSLDMFSLKGLIFIGHIAHLSLYSVQSEKSALIRMRNQLAGLQPHSATYVLKYEFHNLLKAHALDLYHLTKKLLAYRLQNLTVDLRRDEVHRTLQISVRDIVHNQLIIHSLPELMISYIAGELLKIPYDENSEYDVMEHKLYGHIFPNPAMQSKSQQLKYLTTMMDKLEGKDVVYVTIRILEIGNSIIFR